MRRFFLGLLFVTLTALPAAAADSPEPTAEPLSTYNGEVEITCTHADAAGTGSHVLNRDNTGTGQEALNVSIFDGKGTLIYELDFSNVLAEFTGGLGDFTYTTPPAFNPITFVLTSLAGNGLPEVIDVFQVGLCDTLTYIPHTVGAVDPATGQWHLLDESGAATSFVFGNPGDLPMMGDWDGDGIDTPGLYRQSDGFVYLRNSNNQGIADVRFFFGNPGDVPLAGDFDGDGFDTVSIGDTASADLVLNVSVTMTELVDASGDSPDYEYQADASFRAVDPNGNEIDSGHVSDSNEFPGEALEDALDEVTLHYLRPYRL